MPEIWVDQKIIENHLSGKVKVLDLIRKESFAEVAKIYDENVSSLNEIMRREK